MDLKLVTPEKAQMVQDAIAAGYTAEHSEFCVDLVRRSSHAKPRLLVALRLFADGSAIDGKMDLSAAKAMRNVNEMRQFLGLALHETPLQRLTRVVELAFREGREYAYVETGKYKPFAEMTVRALTKRGYRVARKGGGLFFVFPKTAAPTAPAATLGTTAHA